MMGLNSRLWRIKVAATASIRTGPPDTTAEKTTWLGSGLASSDVHADDDVCPLARLNSTLSEKGECKLVDDRKRHSAVVEEKVQFPREANG